MIGKQIREIRQQKGIKAKYITNSFGKSPSWLSLIESGRNSLAAEYLKPMADLLGVSVEVLLSEQKIFDSKTKNEQAASSA